MTRADRTVDAAERHLTDEQLFALALPPAAEPEALPGHLAGCTACGRALQEWKSAVRDLKQQDTDLIGRRTESEWNAREEATLAALHRARRRRSALPVAAGIAASFLVVALVATARRSSPPPPQLRAAASATTAAPAPAEELSGQDLADDNLLREVADLARGDDGSAAWSALADDASGSGEGPL